MCSRDTLMQACMCEVCVCVCKVCAPLLVEVIVQVQSHHDKTNDLGFL